MSEGLYRIKLYGHVGGDEEDFCRNLAAVLHVDEGKAKSLVAGVPSVLREGVPKHRAEVLMGALKIIRALVIMEPMEGGALPERTALEKERDYYLGTDALRSEQPSSKLKSIWMQWGVGLTALAIVLVAILVLYLAAGRPKSTTSVTHSPGIAHRRVSPPPEETSPYEDLTLDELDQKLSELDKVLAEQAVDLRESRKFLARLQNTPGMDREQLTKKKREVVAMRNRFRATAREIRAVKRRIAMVEALKARSSSRQTTPPPRSGTVTSDDETSAPITHDSDLPPETRNAGTEDEGETGQSETRPVEPRPDR
jgi:hypothetical protein